MKTCVYCDEIKETRKWNGEAICRECLEDHFEDKIDRLFGTKSKLERLQDEMDAFFNPSQILR